MPITKYKIKVAMPTICNTLRKLFTITFYKYSK